MAALLRPLCLRCRSSAASLWLIFIFLLSPHTFCAPTPIAADLSRRSGDHLPDLQKRFAVIAQAAEGKVGVTAELLETGESISLNGETQFPMQSVYKLPIAMLVLHQVDAGVRKLDQRIHVTTNDFVTPSQHSPLRDAHPRGADFTVSNLLQLMVSESDGTACDVLLRVLGGPATANGYLRTLGVTNVTIASTEKEMGTNELVQYRNWATPEGFTAVLRIVQAGQGLSASSHQLLLRLLTENPVGPQRLKGLLPTVTLVAHKTGTSRTINGLTRATNDAGIITLPSSRSSSGRHLAITVFVSDSSADQVTREAVIAGLSRAAWDYFVSQSP